MASPGATRRDRQTLALVHALAGDTDEAGRIAQSDIYGAELEQNLRFYKALQGLSPESRRKAVLLGVIE